MPKRLKRATCLRLAVGMAVCAFPLLGAGVAQAALAGAVPAQFSAQPNLRSATINPIYTNVVEVCFDKTINGAVAFNNIKLGGYRAGNLLTASGAAPDQTAPNCAVVTFPANGFDTSVHNLSQYSFLETLPGAVFANVGTVPNLADSVGLTGSTSHSGTTGVQSQPNLVGVLVPDGAHLATNSLTYVFDKDVHVTNVGDFFFENAAGSLCLASSVLSGNDSSNVTVTFTGGGCIGPVATVGSAVRAGVYFDAVQAEQDKGSAIGNGPQSTILANCASPCATSRPDNTGATLGSDYDSIVFTFDKNVIVNGSGAGTFFAVLANGNVVPSTGAVLTGPQQVTASFSGTLSNKAEFGVDAFALFGAVFASDNITASGENFPGGSSIGGNPGAFASGFTTAPDSFGVSINHSNGAIAVNLDDRIIPGGVNTGLITLYSAAGNVVPAVPSSVNYNSSAGPGPLLVTIQYPPTSITNVTGVQIGQGAFTGPIIGALADSQSVPQIDDPPNTAAILRAYKAYTARLHHRSKHHKHH